MKTHGLDATSIDRAAGDGPPRCCATDVVAADELVWCGGLSEEMKDALRAAVPRWTAIADDQFYLCGSCRELAFRHKVISREDWARGHGLSVEHIAAAWVHDEQFWRRGPSSAPSEVRAQHWWPQYQARAAARREQQSTSPPHSDEPSVKRRSIWAWIVSPFRRRET